MGVCGDIPFLADGNYGVMVESPGSWVGGPGSDGVGENRKYLFIFEREMNENRICLHNN